MKTHGASAAAQVGLVVSAPLEPAAHEKVAQVPEVVAVASPVPVQRKPAGTLQAVPERQGVRYNQLGF